MGGGKCPWQFNSSEALWGAVTEKPSTAPFFGTLFLFLNHFVCGLLSFTNGILFVSFPPAERSGRDGGAGEMVELEKWSRSGKYEGPRNEFHARQ